MFQPSFESLGHYVCPDWFRDAKFGIWSHWGPQSVPMYGDWYARNMYLEGSDQYLYHLRHYGHPSEFGYLDLCGLWRAENWDPAELMSLYRRAGARYFVAQATHHDHFFNYDSALHRYNSVRIGPGRDICAEWQRAAHAENLPFGLTEHLGASFSWWAVTKGHDRAGPCAGVPYDGTRPERRDFYHPNEEHVAPDMHHVDPWYTTNERFRAFWLEVMRELIDRFHPDLLYTDGALPFGRIRADAPDAPDFQYGLEAVSYFYNDSIRCHGSNQAVYTQKDPRAEIHCVGVLDIEKSQLPDIAARPWQTDTCIGNWFYDVRQHFKTPGHVIDILIDVVSKNGTLLLNILQKPDGSIDAETRYLLEELAGWFSVAGEAIHGTRPWDCYGEGPSTVLIEGFREDEVAWTETDFRFTRRGGTVYAFIMGEPGTRALVLRSFAGKDISAIRLLGAGDCRWQFFAGILTVELPEQLPTPYRNVLAVELARTT